MKGLFDNKLFKILYTLFRVCFILIIVLYLSFIIVQRLSGNKSILGYRLFNVATGSMTGVYDINDVIAVKDWDTKKLKVGDDVAYRGSRGGLNGLLITHRIIKIDEREDGSRIFTTQGVNAPVSDPTIEEGQILGKVVGIVPVITQLNHVVKSQAGFFLLVFCPLVLVIVLEVLQTITDIRVEKNEIQKIEKNISKKKNENKNNESKVKKDSEKKEHSFKSKDENFDKKNDVKELKVKDSDDKPLFELEDKTEKKDQSSESEDSSKDDNSDKEEDINESKEKDSDSEPLSEIEDKTEKEDHSSEREDSSKDDNSDNEEDMNESEEKGSEKKEKFKIVSDSSIEDNSEKIEIMEEPEILSSFDSTRELSAELRESILTTTGDEKETETYIDIPSIEEGKEEKDHIEVL